jgi:molybdopterin converting factor small subunit
MNGQKVRISGFSGSQRGFGSSFFNNRGPRSTKKRPTEELVVSLFASIDRHIGETEEEMAIDGEKAVVWACLRPLPKPKREILGERARHGRRGHGMHTTNARYADIVKKEGATSMFPIGSGPQSAAERARQAQLEQLGGTEGVEVLPGVRELTEWGKAQREQKRLEQQQRQQERQRTLEAQAAEEMRSLKARLREQYLAAGGDAEGFERAWPGMRDKVLEERTLAPEDYYNAARSAF